MALTKPQRARLDKLATYLEGLPEDYGRFEMSWWIIDTISADAVREYALRNGGVETCGTAACAAGHGPEAGILVPPRFVTDTHINWRGYCALFVGHRQRDIDWCFSAEWRDLDNHHYGAAARMRYLLDKNRPPAGFVDAGGGDPSLYAPYRIDAKAPA